MKKIITSTIMSALAVFLLSCNAAEEGFNAPTGSTVAFTSDSQTFSFPAEGVAGSCFTSTLHLATFQVLIPIEALGPDDPETSGGISQAGNEIQGVIHNTYPDIYKFKDGVETFLPESSLVDFVASGTMPFVTDHRGLFTFAYTVDGCYDGDGNLVSGETELVADIGVSLGELPITISE